MESNKRMNYNELVKKSIDLHNENEQLKNDKMTISEKLRAAKEVKDQALFALRTLLEAFESKVEQLNCKEQQLQSAVNLLRINQMAQNDAAEKIAMMEFQLKHFQKKSYKFESANKKLAEKLRKKKKLTIQRRKTRKEACDIIPAPKT
ncbi:unnamed protein product [Caenorhabditis bovis]|uniref:Uncharacterized protein n=1 Tax=Caenorhabditis bovis TaxID=2654633 RepID=A0A8S1EBA1_9PELO|nr:unnamed protein product [Caenorhabditis bovis]